MQDSKTKAEKSTRLGYSFAEVGSIAGLRCENRCTCVHALARSTDPSTRFFFLFDYRIRHCSHFDTSPPGAFGRNGFHGESAWPDETELGLLRAHWIIGPPFVDPKSLATMSNAGDVGGWQTKVVDSVFKTLHPFSSTRTVLVQKLGYNVVDFVFKNLCLNHHVSGVRG